MRAYSKEKEKFNLTLRMYTKESFDITIPKRTNILINSFQYYDTTTKKQETIAFYDYLYHLDKFGFE